jgi:hypothetical protein
MLDYRLESYDDAYTEYMRLREIRRADEANARIVTTQSDSKASYEQKKRDNAQKRSNEKKLERARAKIVELEAELESLDEELFGEAASDYVRASEIENRKEEIETELLELYELVLE